MTDDAPSLRPIFEEHVADNGEVLPHVFFGLVTEWARDAANDPRHSDELDRLLAALEQGLIDGEARIVNLVEVSFVENAQPPSEFVALRERIMACPRLREAYLTKVGDGYW